MKLKRELGLLETTFYGIGVIIGAGIFALIGEVAGLAGNSAWISFLIGAFVAIFTGLTYAELSAMYPKAGAVFVYVKKAYGSDFWAFLIGWLLIFALISGTAAVSLGFSGYFIKLFEIEGSFARIVVSIFLILVLSFLNFAGIKESSRFFITTSSLVLFSLILIIFSGFFVSPINFKKFFEAPSLTGVFSAAALVFFAYLGFEDVVNLAEETKNPTKIIPLALILSVIITTVIYVLVSISVLNLVGWEELSRSSAPLALAASKVLGDKAFIFISLAALLTTADTSLGLMLSASRIIYGMARENSLPKILSRIHPNRKTPYIAIFLVTTLAIVFVFLRDIEKVAKLTSLGSLLAFIAANLSLIHLRFMRPDIKRKFLAPLNIGKFPLTAFFGTISCMALLGYFEIELIFVTLAILATGSLVFIIRKKRKKSI
ncbi:MAG: amino acid permease [Candidatus Aenigmatarchaeota archaeon]